MEDFKCEISSEPPDPCLLVYALFGATPEEWAEQLAQSKRKEE